MNRKPRKIAAFPKQETETRTINIAPLWRGVAGTIAYAAVKGQAWAEEDLDVMAQLADFANEGLAALAGIVLDPKFSPWLEANASEEFAAAKKVIDEIEKFRATTFEARRTNRKSA